MMPLLLLDRDGVLNEMVVDEEHGTVDSPMNIDQVKIIKGVPAALFKLQEMGFGLTIVTNQPAAAKKKTTMKNLEAVHSKIVGLVELEGAKILSSHICYHTSEMGCNCRKPKTGLLEQAFEANSSDLTEVAQAKARSLMVGDGMTDVLAGVRMGVKTAFLGPKKCDHCKVFENLQVKPDFWVSSLVELAKIMGSMNSDRLLTK